MMRSLNEYMAMSYRMEIVEDKDEGGYVVSFPDLPGCLTCGETMKSAVANARDAKKTWLETSIEDGIEIQEPDSLEDSLDSLSCGSA
ncbi:MAG: type II toxin-antitoxin system HicB family antitoxin [Candidatus Gastranaerophilales bacterium]|nr:type II toxin-antitoxin system HicB family antitoxin [Candidatus Gastranaerophilales bacterium]